jgi:TRAP-type C4-dicarboxylate transport system substrate-binding protein
MFDIDGGWPRELGNSKKPVYVPDDTKGIKIRTTGAPVEVALFKAWGASAIPIAWSELYTALQQKVVDAHYNQPLHTYKVAKFHEIIKYYTFVTQSWCGSVKVLGKEAEKKLGPEYYNMLVEAGKKAELYKDTLTDTANQESIESLKKAGVQLIYPTAEQMELWNEKSKSIWPEFIGPGKDISQDLIDKVVSLAK